MTTFDAPSREFCTIRRIRTNTPLQALVTLNDPVFVESAQALARRVLREGGNDFDARATFALRLVVARQPGVAELDRLRNHRQCPASEVLKQRWRGETPAIAISPKDTDISCPLPLQGEDA